MSQDPIRLVGGDNFYAYVHDSNYWIDPNGLMAFGSGKGTHNATVNVYDSSGGLIHSEAFQSGNMTATEKALGFPQSTLATHTEARAVKKLPLEPGQTMEILGEYPPCNSCKGKMRAASGVGATIDYKWADDLGDQHVRFENGKKTLDTKSKNPKLNPGCG
ncbi:MAG: hypothetical protein P8P74_05615 [Crocinitomicaceae bacterium]|nr:hypothetical protein [Crocinitomicaceae bacterium]